MCIMLVSALNGHVLNLIFAMKYETYAYGIEFEMKNDFAK